MPKNFIKWDPVSIRKTQLEIQQINWHKVFVHGAPPESVWFQFKSITMNCIHKSNVIKAFRAPSTTHGGTARDKNIKRLNNKKTQFVKKYSSEKNYSSSSID